MNAKHPIRVLIVDDSAVIQQLLVEIFQSDPELRVIGIASDGLQAVQMASRFNPDVITMDINMPRMNGVEATRQIMERHPTPIVIITTSENAKDVQVSYQAMEAGALTILQKPLGPLDPHFPKICRNIIATVKSMSEIQVITRRPAVSRRAPKPDMVYSTSPVSVLPSEALEMIGIGASTGGPPVLYNILSKMPANFPVPILIVQHISYGFTAGLARWLDEGTPLTVTLAAHLQQPRAGHVYLAPDDQHMEIRHDGRIALSKSPPVNNLRPSVSKLFRSLAEVYGPRALGILLTGMGKDGAAELKKMRDKGAVTIAQDQKSSIVFGMPGEAVKLGAAKYVLPAADIVTVLLKSACRTHFKELR